MSAQSNEAAIEKHAKSQLFEDIRSEVERATTKFPTWPTDPIHAFAVVGEEFGEAQKEILQLTYEPHKSSKDAVRKEATQLAAMAIRFLMSLDRYEYTPIAQHSQSEPAPPQPAPEPTSGAAVVTWTIQHPGTMLWVECDSFEDGMKRWFEGYNPPHQVRGGFKEMLTTAHARVKAYYAGELPKVAVLPAPAPTITDVSAAVREAAEKEIQSFLCEGDHGKPEWTPTGTHVQALLSTQRATDRQRIAELESALKQIATPVFSSNGDGTESDNVPAYELRQIARKALLS